MKSLIAGIVLTGAALLLTGTAPQALSQPTVKVARVGVLLYGTPDSDPNARAFKQGLAELGYVEGKNLAMVYRYAEGKPERLAELAADLVLQKPDVILALGGDVAPFAKAATQAIPIVAAFSNDPAGAGLVASLAKPGGNLTGVSFVSSELAAKRLQYLKQAVPDIQRVAVLWNPDHVDPEFRETQAAGRLLGIRVQSLEIRSRADFDAALRAATEQAAQAIVVVSSRLTSINRRLILDHAARQRIPVVAGWGEWVEGGALLSYGPDLDLMVRRAAAYVDRVLKGAKPAELPIEQPTRFSLFISLRTARTLGLTIPPAQRLQADHIVD